MLILSIRTDKPEAEVGLLSDHEQLACTVWSAHRELAQTIHAKINDLLIGQQKSLTDINGVVVYQGPGSFTGLRIGITVGNTLADSLGVSIVGETGDDWLLSGQARLQNGDNDQLVLPEYGAPPKTTTPKH